MPARLLLQHPDSLIVKKAKNGLGIFSTRPFKKGQVIFQVEGKRVHYLETNKWAGRFQDNTFRYGPDTYISPENELADYLNHSCIPNSKVEKINHKLYILAVSNIGKDQEILIDYSTILARDDIWVMKCSCGEKACRKRIVTYTRLPRQILEKYKALAIIPNYILKI